MADPGALDPKPEPDPLFEPLERLYRRIPLRDVEAGSISDASIPAPAFSVDRGKYRLDPREMLVEHPRAGIAAFCVKHIPAEITSDDGRRYEFGVEHRPEPENYSHSEVHTYYDGNRLDDLQKEPPRQVRKKFRDLLRQGIVILDLTITESTAGSARIRPALD